MFEWIGDHWFELLVLAGLYMISLCLRSIGTASVDAINGQSTEIIKKLEELGRCVLIVDRRLERIALGNEGAGEPGVSNSLHEIAWELTSERGISAALHEIAWELKTAHDLKIGPVRPGM